MLEREREAKYYKGETKGKRKTTETKMEMI